MIAARRTGQRAPGGDRLLAIILAALVHLVLALALFSGLRVRIDRQAESRLQLIDVTLAPVVPPPPVARLAPIRSESRAAAPRAAKPNPGGTTSIVKAVRSEPIVSAPAIALPVLKVAAGGGSAGLGGFASGSGAGGGNGGEGDGSGGGGTDLVQIDGDIRPSDYPRDLRDAGIGGRVGIMFTVAPNGRVSRCSVTRSSGVPELDQLTCRLIEQRFVYRPSTDRLGRPIADEVEGEHIWDARRR